MHKKKRKEGRKGEREGKRREEERFGFKEGGRRGERDRSLPSTNVTSMTTVICYP
jgi:hypothetical protein